MVLYKNACTLYNIRVCCICTQYTVSYNYSTISDTISNFQSLKFKLFLRLNEKTKKLIAEFSTPLPHCRQLSSMICQTVYAARIWDMRMISNCEAIRLYKSERLVRQKWYGSQHCKVLYHNAYKEKEHPHIWLWHWCANSLLQKGLDLWTIPYPTFHYSKNVILTKLYNFSFCKKNSLL